MGCRRGDRPRPDRPPATGRSQARRACSRPVARWRRPRRAPPGERAVALAGQAGHAGRSARGPRGLRRLRLARHRQQPGVRRGRPRQHDPDHRRTAGARGRPQRSSVRRTRGSVARPDARQHRADPGGTDADAAAAVASARRPPAVAGGNRDLPAVPAPADRAARNPIGSCCSAVTRRAHCCLRPSIGGGTRAVGSKRAYQGCRTRCPRWPFPASPTCSKIRRCGGTRGPGLRLLRRALDQAQT